MRERVTGRKQSFWSSFEDCVLKNRGSQPWLLYNDGFLERTTEGRAHEFEFPCRESKTLTVWCRLNVLYVYFSDSRDICRGHSFHTSGAWRCMEVDVLIIRTWEEIDCLNSPVCVAPNCEEPTNVRTLQVAHAFRCAGDFLHHDQGWRETSKLSKLCRCQSMPGVRVSPLVLAGNRSYASECRRFQSRTQCIS